MKIYGEMSGGFEFKYVALIVAAVFGVIYYVSNLFIEKYFNKRKESWIQSLYGQ